MKPTQQPNNTNRRKALYLLTGALSALAFWKLPKFIKPEEPAETPKPTTVKMLTQDGQLVEVDERFITNRQPKISTTEIQNWVHDHK